VREEAPLWSRTLPQLPRLAHRLLTDDTTRRVEVALLRIERAQVVQTRVLAAVVAVLTLLAVGLFLR
jgi:hypothetical protein